MTPKERVRAALNHEVTDRVPIFMWFQPSTTRRLAALLEIPEQDVAEAMGNDVFQTWVNNNYAMEGIKHDRDGEGHTDHWGIEWVKDGEFNQIRTFPLEHATTEEVLAYRFPEEHLDDLLGLMDAVMTYAGRHFIGVDVSPCAFEMYWRLRGMGQTLLEMAAAPELADSLMTRCADFAVRLAQESLARFAVDWLWTGDDVAGQESLLMSPEMWRAMVKPHLRRVVDVGKAQGLPVAYHCCGALRPIIPDLIEIGIDVLNPVQANCPGMAPDELKREFGEALTFMGGVDTQGLLPGASADEVFRETARLIETMGEGGGYILAASHTVPPETPLENLFAMYAAVGISREAIFDQAAQIRAGLMPR